MAQFDALLAILEPQVKKTTNFRELCVCLYGGSELSKHLSKCLLWMQKLQKIEPDLNFFMTDESFGGSV